MWSFDKAKQKDPRPEGRLKGASRSVGRMRSAVLGVIALAAAFPLAGCIEPLYGANNGFDSSPLASELQSIEVEEIQGRIGHYLRNDLIYGFNGTGSTVQPRYRLSVTLRERVQTPIIDTVTYRATSATVIVDADYKLLTVPKGEEVLKGTAFNIASYDRFSNRFANVRAARDGEIRDAKVIAEAIRTRIATEFAARGPSVAAAH
jgi:LPS-assembly lipoprotein